MLLGCSGRGPFSGYHKEVFPVTKITEEYTKTIQILNESSTDIQHIVGIAFYSDSNKSGHFQVSEVKIGDSKVGLKDIFIPPMGVLNIVITYAPLDLDTTVAAYGGWTTTEDDKEIVEVETEEEPSEDSTKAVQIMSTMMKNSSGEKEFQESAIHRAMLVVAYDEPRKGYNHVELVGGAIPGPNGETTAVGIGKVGEGDCSAGGTTACFRGSFSIDLPGLMSSGPVEVPMSGPVPIKVESGAAEINMDEFPPVLIVVKGNGPGEPLEGKPVDAISIVISGTSETKAVGSFDGRSLSLSQTSFRVRVLLGEITYEDINPGLAAAVDFDISDLDVVTDEPFDGSKIIFGVETTLSDNPSGNGLFDSFLGGARVIVKFNGMLELP